MFSSFRNRLPHAACFLFRCISILFFSFCFIFFPVKIIIRWAIYKFPKLTGNSNPDLAAGYGYAYMDKNNMRWTVAQDTYLTDDNIALTYTMDQIYEASTDGDIGWGLYNDETPDGKTSGYRGHAKGVTAFDSEGGFFIDHSVH